MLQLARRCINQRWLVVISWIVVMGAALGISSAVGSHYGNDFSLSGTDSQHALDLLTNRFPAEAGDSDQIVFHARSGKLSDPSVRPRIEAMLSNVKRLPHVASVQSPYATNGQAISANGTIAYATVNFDQSAFKLPHAATKKMMATATAVASPSLQIEFGGDAIDQASNNGEGPTFLIGIGTAIVVLLISFGSLLAMGLPIGTALLGLGTGSGLIGLLSRVLSMPGFASQIALMIGLGVGVDYALFIVTRFREAYRRNGGDVDSAVGEAMNTAGRAVIFAGLTVVIALLGMFALGLSLLNGLAASAAIAVLMVLAASLTLLPALLSFFGARIGRPGRFSRRSAASAGDRSTFWTRWIDAVQRRPWAALVASAGVLVVLALPVFSMNLGNTDAGNQPTSHTTRRAYDLVADGFGKGFSGPLLVAVELPRPGDTASLPQLESQLRQTPGVAAVTPATLSPGKDAAALSVFPKSSPQSNETKQLVKHLRHSVIPPLEHASGTKAYIGGTTANGIDFSNVLSSGLPYFIGIVVLLSALLLMVVFRSLVIPLQAAVMNLLSIGAAMGVVVAVFQYGWLGSLFGIAGGPIAAFIPVMVFAIVFGLSMDYEVFLISRIHEEWTHRRDSTAAVREGLIRTGRVITAAAAVMVVVFVSFAGGGERIVQLFGIGLAVAVFLDALVIRVLLLPATLQLLGERTWAFPAWLDRRLPRFAIEAPEETGLSSATPTQVQPQ